MLFFFLRAGGKEGWVGKLNVPGQGGGGLFVYWINTVICLSLDCHLNKVSVAWCTDDDDDDDDDEQTYCLSTEDDNQLPVCFIATLYRAKMFIVEGHWSAESYIIMSHTTNKAIISKHHNDYYTLQTLELTGKTWCVQHVHQLWAFTLS